MVLVLIDNYDSFTWNIYQYLCSLGAEVQVFRNDQVTLDTIIALKPTHVVISPGPGHPSTDAGISKDVIRYFAGKVPVLGVCMGHQCIYEVFGGKVAFAGEIVHGKTSIMEHDGAGLFKDIEPDIRATRYHSLAGDPATLPKELVVTARTSSGVIQGIRHRTLCVSGVQFHPESILSDAGMKLLENFLKMHAGTWAEQPEFGIKDASLGPMTTITMIKDAEPKKSSILQKIQQQRLKDVAHDKAQPGRSEEDLRALVQLGIAAPALDFYQRLKSAATPNSPAVMAEVKRASPSKGDINIHANAALQARKYAEAGAAAISILTEPTWFKGRLEDMRLARDAVAHLPERPAILRKDFIVDTYQIYEARLYGADTVLLIVAMLTDAQLKTMINCSREIGMEPLVEVNNAEEMERALKAGARVIGVNNRSLHTFDVDPNTTLTLADRVPKDVILAALSGITSRADVEPYLKAGARAVLVGEALMRASDPARFIHRLRNTDVPEVAPILAPPKVKICGVRSVEAALAAYDAGADFIGIIFAETRRKVSIDTARAIADAIRAKAQKHNDLIPLTPARHIEVEDWFGYQSRTLAEAHRPLIVGVFQNQSVGYIEYVTRQVGLDLIQLHGDEPAELPRFLSRPVIRAFHIPKPNADPDAATGITKLKREITREGYHALPLLDAFVPGAAHQGGQGVQLDWPSVQQMLGPIDQPRRLPIILAGGLCPENVSEAIKLVRPWAVDVSSGVETDGVKDLKKIAAFVQAAKAPIV